MTAGERLGLLVAAIVLLSSRRSSAMPSTPASSPHAWARPILARAYRAVFNREPTAAELQFLAAWSWVESRYGRAGQLGQRNTYNWGSVLCGPLDAPADCEPFTDRRADGTVINVRARKYKDDDDGAADLVRQCMVTRPRSGTAIRDGKTVYRASVALRRERYYGGLCPIVTQRMRAMGSTSEEIRRSPDCAREATTGRALAVWAAVQQIAQALGEPIAWQLGSYDEAMSWYEAQTAPGPVAPSSWPLGPSLRQSEVTPAMTQWAQEVRRSQLPIGGIAGPRTFMGFDGAAVEVLAHVELHPPSAAVPKPHRGVGLYHTPGTKPAAPPGPGPAPSSENIYRSTAAHVHPAGWLALPSGLEITRMPLIDDAGLFARLGAADAAKILAAMGMRLPSAQELLQLRAAALFIEPYTLPTPAMTAAAGVPRPWQDSQGRDTPQMAAYRAANMSSRAWAELHDAEVMRRLAAAYWTSEPVANAGKHWTMDGGILGWWFKGGGQIQGLSHKHEPGFSPHVPPLGNHVDYGTTIHAVRKAGTPV